MLDAADQALILSGFSDAECRVRIELRAPLNPSNDDFRLPSVLIRSFRIANSCLVQAIVGDRDRLTGFRIDLPPGEAGLVTNRDGSLRTQYEVPRGYRIVEPLGLS